jgi:hypothetical protein
MPIKEFYDACVTRFDDDMGLDNDLDTSLKRLGRRLYIGFAGDRLKSVIPYVEMHMIIDETEDTFGSDLEGGTYQFSLFTDSRDPDRAYDLRKNVIRVFDNAKVAEPTAGTTFTTVAFERLSGGFGPRIVDGVFQSRLYFQILIQLTTQNPATRYA